VLLSDSQTSKVLENNFSGNGANMQRALRSDKSALNPGITWEFTDAIAVVNSFLLLGNHDNHRTSYRNTNRWQSFRTQLQKYGKTITIDELKLIASFDNDYSTDDGIIYNYNIYNSSTQQIVLFQPDNFHLEVAFRPRSGILPADPVFENIPVEWINNLPYGHSSVTTDKLVYSAGKDTIKTSAVIENPNSHELSAKLIFESLDGTVTDSTNMTNFNLTEEAKWQTNWKTYDLPENMYWITLKVTDKTDGTIFTYKYMTRITTIPIELSKITFIKISNSRYKVQPRFTNLGKSKVLSKPTIDVTSNDPWIRSIGPDLTTLSYLKPGQPRNTESFTILSDAATFPGYFNLTVKVASDDWPYWTFDTTIAIITTGIEQVEFVPLAFGLEQNYPNPFNAVTTINWQLAESSKVTLKVLDIVGRTIATLIDEQRPQGKYETRFDAATLPKGIYFCQLKAGENMQTKKMILIE
jgi:hypothetical protein